jgi:5-methylcytosine-specific restriction endonuclease McrA
MTEKEFIDSKAWRKKREYILRRDKYQCQYCKRYGKRTEATEVHHIKHYADYPEFGLADSNLVSLCHSCHNKQHPEKGGTRRRERNSGR